MNLHMNSPGRISCKHEELRNSMEISSIFWRPKTVVSTVELLSVSMVFYSFKIHQNVFCLSV